LLHVQVQLGAAFLSIFVFGDCHSGFGRSYFLRLAADGATFKTEIGARQRYHIFVWHLLPAMSLFGHDFCIQAEFARGAQEQVGCSR
jgi:hypothetical protein